MSEATRPRHDFKDIGPANWQSVDEQSALWMQMTSAARTQREWVDFYLRPTLKPTVPKEIVALLEAARGAMIYGWYFYPLVTLGAEQCWRVLESAVRLRCQEVGIPTKRTGPDGREWDTRFSENIDALMASNRTPKVDKTRWDAVRSLRNSASHPNRQMILDPGQAQGVLEMTVEILNGLFP